MEVRDSPKRRSCENMQTRKQVVLAEVDSLETALPLMALLSCAKRDRRCHCEDGRRFIVLPFAEVQERPSLFPLQNDTSAYLRARAGEGFYANPEGVENTQGNPLDDPLRVQWVLDIGEVSQGACPHTVAREAGKKFLQESPEQVLAVWQELRNAETFELFWRQMIGSPQARDVPASTRQRVQKLASRLTLQQFNRILFKAACKCAYLSPYSGLNTLPLIQRAVEVAERLVASGVQNSKPKYHTPCWRRGTRSLVAETFSRWVLPMTEEESTRAFPSLDLVLELREEQASDGIPDAEYIS